MSAPISVGFVVWVWAAGTVKEYNSPARLIEQQPESLFASLVHEYGARSKSNGEQKSST